MDAKTARKYLNEYSHEQRELDAAEYAIGLLERMDSEIAQKCVSMLKGEQRKILKRLDKAAADLGAPYGA